MQDIVAKRSKRSAGARSRAIAVAMQPLEKRVLLSTAYLQPSPLAMYIKPKTKPVAPVTTPTVTAKPVAKPTTTAKPAVSGFSTGDLVVYRVGDGSAALGTSATATFIDEYTTATGQSSPVSGATVALSTPSSGNPLTASGSASSQGYITDSGDGEALLVPGYDAATGTASITGTTSAVPREVDELSPTGATTSQTTIGSGTSSVGTIYGATANTSTSGIYASGSNGITYSNPAGSSATTTQIATSAYGAYGIEISNGQLYISSDNNPPDLGTLGTGLPTTSGQTGTILPGETFSGTSGAGVGYSRAFAFATLKAGDTSPDTLYVADNYNDGIDKLSLVSGKWVLNGEIGAYPSTAYNVQGIVVEPVAGGEQLFFSTTTTIYTVTDPYGYNSAGAASGNTVFTANPTLAIVATAANNEHFFGLAFAPSVPTPSVYAVTVSPTAIASGSSSNTITLTAQVSELGGSPSSVSFYQEAVNGTEAGPGTDTLVPGTATYSSSTNTWTLSGVSTAGLANGNYTFYAIATDSTNSTTSAYGSAPNAALSVGAPTIGSFSITPSTDPVGQATLLSANNVTPAAGDTVASVKFYIQKGTSPQPSTDTLLGTGTQSSSNYTLSFTPSSLPLGAAAYTVYALATGGSGATTNASQTLTVTTPKLAFATSYINTFGVAGNITVTVTRSSDTVDGPITVNYATKNGTATTAAGNYTAASGTLTFPAYNGSNLTAATTQTFTVNVAAPPSTQIGNISFSISLSSPTPTADGVVLPTTAENIIINQIPRPFKVGAGDVVVEQGGDGVDTLSGTNGANTIYMDEYSPTGTLVQSYPLPTTSTGGGNQAIGAGDSGAEGFLSLSENGEDLVVPGYTGTTANEATIGLVDGNSNINTTNQVNLSGSPGTMRGASSDNGTNLYLATSGEGLQYVSGTGGAGQTQSTLTTNPTGNLRATVVAQNGNLYVSSSSSTTGLVLAPYVPASGTGQTLVNLPGITYSAVGGAWQFFFASDQSLDDTLYIANGASSTASFVDKYSDINGTWTAEGSLTLNGQEVVGIAGVQTSPTNVTGYVTVAPFNLTNSAGSTASQLYSFTDTLSVSGATQLSGYLGGSSTSPTPIATLPSASGTASLMAEYHGVAMAPQLATAPVVTTQPVSQSANNGTTVNFTAWASGTPAPTVQWMQEAPGATSYTAVPVGSTPVTSGTFTTYQVAASDALNGYKYEAVFTNASAPSGVPSNAATLTVVDAPTVSSLSVSGGTDQGGTAVTINGLNFTSGETVTLGGQSVSSMYVSPTSITFTTPSASSLGLSDGTYDVVVNDNNGTGASATSSADQFTYATTPTVTGISPTSGTDGGGTSVTITGTGFFPGATVKFGVTAATVVSVTTTPGSANSTITVTSPAGTKGQTVDVEVTTSVGTSLPVTADQFTFNATTIATAQGDASQTPVTLDDNPIVTAILQTPGTYNGSTYTTWSFLLNDGTGSIDVSSTLPANYTPAVGDILNSISGTFYNGLDSIPQLINVTAVSKQSSGNTVPTAYYPTDTLAYINQNFTTSAVEAQFITIDAATITHAGASTFGTADINADISDSTVSNDSFFYYPVQFGASNQFFYGLPVPTSAVTITGIVDDFFGAPEFIPISEGATDKFSLASETANGNPLSGDTNSNGESDGYLDVTRGTNITATVTRSETTDNGTVEYAVIPSNATYGTDFTVPGSTLQAATSTSPAEYVGTLTFPSGSSAGATTQTFAIDTNASPGDQGAKLFTITLTNPTTDQPVTGSNSNGITPVITGGPATIVTLDGTSGTSTVFAAPSVGSGSSIGENADIEPGGPAVNTSNKINSASVNVEGTGNNNGNNTSYAILTYDDQSYDPTNVVGDNPQGTPPNTDSFRTIDGLQLETTATSNSFDVSGSLNVYLLSTPFVGGNPENYPVTGLTFQTDTNNSDTSSDGVGGTLNTTTGEITGAINGSETLYPLGTINYLTSQATGGSTPFNLTKLDPTGVYELAAQLSNGGAFTIVITPGSQNVTATFGGSANAGVNPAPELRVEYSNKLPTWVTSGLNSDNSSQTVWITPTQNLVVTAAATIVSDPGSAEPIIDASGAPAVVTIGNVTGSGATGADFHIGGFNLTNGASAAVTSLGSARSVTNYNLVVLGTSGATVAPAFNIDSTSTLDMTNNDMAILYGSGTSPLSTIQSLLSNAYAGGAWTGTGLTSSKAKTSGGVTALGFGEASTLVADGESSFDGLSLSGLNAVMIKYTLVGDTTLSGSVGLGDYNKVIANFNGSGDSWTSGGFDYSGNVGLAEYNDVLKNFNLTLADVLPPNGND